MVIEEHPFLKHCIKDLEKNREISMNVNSSETRGLSEMKLKLGRYTTMKHKWEPYETELKYRIFWAFVGLIFGYAICYILH